MRGTLGLFGALVVFGTLALASARTRPDESMPGPTGRERSDDRLDRNDECEGCHAEIAKQWRGSLHRASYTDPMLQAALAKETDPAFCRSCHAPEADPSATPDARRAEIGVGCVGCHVVDDEILAAPRADASAAPHPVRRDSKFAGAEACAGCHEFWFPSKGRGGHELIMQRTLSEHRRSAAHDQPCQSCHMPPTPSGRSHGFHVAGDVHMLESAATISGVRELDEQGRAVVRLTLEPRAIGHAFPTGDLFRRLLVRVEADGDARCEAERFLARRFGLERITSGSVIRVELDDDRVGLRRDARIVEFVLPSECAEQALTWSVSYQRVLDTPIGDEHAAVVWDELELARERLSTE